MPPDPCRRPALVMFSSMHAMILTTQDRKTGIQCGGMDLCVRAGVESTKQSPRLDTASHGDLNLLSSKRSVMGVSTYHTQGACMYHSACCHSRSSFLLSPLLQVLSSAGNESTRNASIRNGSNGPKRPSSPNGPKSSRGPNCILPDVPQFFLGPHSLVKLFVNLLLGLGGLVQQGDQVNF